MAKQARGYKSAMVIDFEASFGVAPGTKKGVALPMNSNDLSKVQTLIESDTITNMRNDTQPALGRVSVDRDIEMPADYVSAGYMLKALFTSTEWMDKADTGAAVAMEIGFKLDENTSLVFAMPTVQFEPFDAQISGSAGVVVEVKWRAFSADGTSIVTTTLKNQQEAY